MRERDRGREFTSTPLARHSAPDCDIYPPSLTNPMLLPPTRFDLASYLSPSVGSLSTSSNPIPGSLCHSNHPSYPFVPPLPSTRNSTPPRTTLSLSSPPLRFCLRSAMLGLRVSGVALGGGWLPLDDSRHHFVHEKNSIYGVYNTGGQERNRKRRTFSLFPSCFFFSFDASQGRWDFQLEFFGALLSRVDLTHARNRSSSIEYLSIHRLARDERLLDASQSTMGIGFL